MNRYHLKHVTDFFYDTPVLESYNEVRLRPMEDERQSCISFRLTTTPASKQLSYRDAMGNWVHHFNVLPSHQHLRVEAESVVLAHDGHARHPCPMTASEFDALPANWNEDYADFLLGTAYVPLLAQLIPLCRQCEEQADGTIVGFASAVAHLIHDKFRYVKGATHVHSSIRDSLTARAGVCQDFAHLMLAMVRMRGLPGRYVSGYLIPVRDGTPGGQHQEVIGGQASHAWVEVFCPETGWMPFDPTLGKPVGPQHVRVAYGRDYGDAAPVRGVYKGRSGQRLSVDVTVRPALDEEGRELMTEVPPITPTPSFIERPQQPQQQ